MKQRLLLLEIVFYDSTPFLSQEREIGSSIVCVVINNVFFLNTPVAWAVFPDLLVVDESSSQP